MPGLLQRVFARPVQPCLQNGDVLFVAANHRLNILGFLDLSRSGKKYKDTANIGMQNLAASLK